MNWYKKIAEKVQLWEMSPTSKEYADLDIDTVDRMAFGFARNDIKQINPNRLHIKWKGDMNNVVEEQRASGLSKFEWAKKINLSEPIDVIFEDGVFKIDDGHHRYYAAKIRGEMLNINLEIKDKPHQFAVMKAFRSGKNVPQDILRHYELV